MTSTVTELTLQITQVQRSDLHLTAAILLLILLFATQLYTGHARLQARDLNSALVIIVVPLLLAFVSNTAREIFLSLK